MSNAQPLAERLRPISIGEIVGQQHLLGQNGAIRRMLDNKFLPSLIFWGPPGVGKTTLAQVLAQSMKRPFFMLSAIASGVKDVREVLDRATPMFPPILFIDEIHRFSKSQQDALLGAVERGKITLIGATTENPSFEVIPALLSRCQVYTLNAHGVEDLSQLLKRAVEKDEWLQQMEVKLIEEKAIIRLSGGDARKLLNLLELIVAELGRGAQITDAQVEQTAKFVMRYDKGGEQHYDIISAFIKSIRGSDPNAAVYWLARMIEGGEDPGFIARRLVILASEDIGNANPTALIMANNCFQAVKVIGFPESRIILSQTAIYLACSSKSNSAYLAINEAQDLVRKTGNLEIPLHLRNAPTKLMKDLDYGKDYLYAHNYEHNFVQQNFLPKEIEKTQLFKPGKNAREQEMQKTLQNLWKDWYGY